ncbi:DUF4314 domain-containing protein [Phytohabitans kaempferiae]|uniref:DUF4314 domain-containing protein n=1 Tax=Phytohabitans kaempferiae TaxID=1620943 RepID=A0ABV6MA44_9ACTN
MSDPALVGVLSADGEFVARHVHWADGPDRMLVKLRRIWSVTCARDTAAAGRALLGHDWHSLCPSCTCRRHPPNTRRVAGVGHAASHDLPITQGRLPSTERYGYAQWMYLLDESTEEIVVHEITVNGRWLPQSRHLLDPDQRVLDCGGTAGTGHRWEPGRVAVPGPATGGWYGATYEAQVCAGFHPDGFTIARFTDAVASRMVDDAPAHTTAADMLLPLLRRHRGGYELVWADATHRVRRDGDGMLLIGPYLMPWQRVDQPPAEPYREHDRVVLDHTHDSHTRLRAGAEGTVQRYQPRQHTVYVRWDDGSSLAVLLDAGDRIRLVHRPATPHGKA